MLALVTDIGKTKRRSELWEEIKRLISDRVCVDVRQPYLTLAPG